MKTCLVLCLMIAPGLVCAQDAASNNSISSTTTSAQGNLQGITFNNSSPSDVTQNVVSSGTTRLISEYQGSYTVKNVPSVNGPNLTTSNDTCMGSTSGSANGPGFGISLGTTWTDVHCQHLKMSRELWNKGMKAASVALDCMDAAAMVALEMTGTKCPQSMTAEERVAAFGPMASAVGTVTARPAVIVGSLPTSLPTSLPPPLPALLQAPPQPQLQPQPLASAASALSLPAVSIPPPPPPPVDLTVLARPEPEAVTAAVLPLRVIP